MTFKTPTSSTLAGIEISRCYTQAMRKIDGKLSSIHGLSFSDFTILKHLNDAHEHRLRRIDLADLMGVTASAVTRSLLPLEKIGLVARQSDPNDARVGYAKLSRADLRVVGEASLTAESAVDDAFRQIPIATIEQIRHQFSLQP